MAIFGFIFNFVNSYSLKTCYNYFYDYWRNKIKKYSAGENAGGIHAGNRLGGNSLADIFTFGRIAANTAYEDQKDTDVTSGASQR